MKNNIQAEYNLRIEVIISLILGISGLIIMFFSLFIIGLLMQISGLILGIRGLLKSSKKTLAIIGIILCIVGAIVAAACAWNNQKNDIFSCRIGSIYCNFSVVKKICNEMFGGRIITLSNYTSPTVYYYSCTRPGY